MSLRKRIQLAGYFWRRNRKQQKGLLEKVKMQNPDGEYIFMRRGKQLHKGHFNEHLVKYCDEAGVEPQCSIRIDGKVPKLAVSIQVHTFSRK